MNAITGDNNFELPIYDHRKESAIMYGGVGGFAITTFILLTLTAHMMPIGIAGYSVLSVLEAASLVSFVVGFVRRVQKSDEAKQQRPSLHPQTIKPPKVANFCLETIQTDVQLLMDALENFVLTLASTYYKEKGISRSDTQAINDAFKRFKNVISHLLVDYLQDLDRNKYQIFLQDLPCDLVYIMQAFQPNGALSTKELSGIIYTATSLIGRNTITYPFIKSALEKAPFSKQDQKDLYEALTTLIPALANPLYYGTCDMTHPFRIQLANLVKSNAFKAPVFSFANGQRPTLSTFIRGYTDFVIHLTYKLTKK